jgi:hypothetical protein
MLLGSWLVRAALEALGIKTHKVGSGAGEPLKIVLAHTWAEVEADRRDKNGSCLRAGSCHRPQLFL